MWTRLVEVRHLVADEPRFRWPSGCWMMKVDGIRISAASKPDLH
jgi:hypothetical protein